MAPTTNQIMSACTSIFPPDFLLARKGPAPSQLLYCRFFDGPRAAGSGVQTSHESREFTGEVRWLVPVTTSAAAPAWVCASGQRAPAAWRSRVKSDPDRRRAARQSGAARRDAVRGFVVPRRYPPLSASPAARETGRWALSKCSLRSPEQHVQQLRLAASSARKAEQQRFRHRPAASSSQAVGPSLRSSSLPPATNQVPGPLSRLSAWLPHRRTARPRCQRYQCRLRPGNERTPAKLAFSPGFLVLFSSGSNPA